MVMVPSFMIPYAEADKCDYEVSAAAGATPTPLHGHHALVLMLTIQTRWRFICAVLCV